MDRTRIDFNDISIRPHYLWSEKWFLLTCGDFDQGDFNTMTVAWGSFGTMWFKPFVQAVVRNTRYTYEYMNKYNEFTLCAFSANYKPALQMLGSRSGRDGDKIKESGLTPCPSLEVSAPCFEEAELVFECRKLYWDDMKPENFQDDEIHGFYPQKDYHRIFFGEIICTQQINSDRTS